MFSFLIQKQVRVRQWTAENGLSVFVFLAASLSAASPTLAQRAGVLIGTAEGGSGMRAASTYRTFWIAPDAAGKYAVLATIPQLIVPRRDGFWHVGVQELCDFDPPTEMSIGNEDRYQTILAAPIAQEVELVQTCTQHKPEDYASPYNRSEEDKDKISQCGFE
jgi:hypothetical protein